MGSPIQLLYKQRRCLSNWGIGEEKWTLVSTLGGMDCILGMEFITQNNVLIEGHNRLVRIPSKSGIV